jgi:hypothetical protein
MIKTCLLSGICLFAFFISQGQRDTLAKFPMTGKNSQVSFAIDVPVGAFGRSHVLGAGLSYSWSHSRFRLNVTTLKEPGFTANVGANYYLGKKIRSAGYPFQYGGYFLLHVFPGIIINPYPEANIVFSAGPLLSIYRGNANAGLGVKLSGNYFLNEAWSIGPAINYRKNAKEFALWSAGVQLSYIF